MSLNSGARHGSVERRLDCGYTVNVELTGFLDRLELDVREREPSRLTPNGLVPAIRRMELPFNEMGEADEGED